MNQLRKFPHRRWLVPTVSGSLIALSFLFHMAFGLHLWGDVFMISAAVVAGYGIVVDAVRALGTRTIGIDQLLAEAIGDHTGVDDIRHG